MFDLVNRAKSFLSNDSQFWFYHGYGLTFLWLVLAVFAISIRSYRGSTTKWIHTLLFSFIDYSTFFLGGGVLYKYWGSITSQFFSWPLTQQIHSVLGLLFVVFVFLQHFVGAVLFHKGYFRGFHIKQGYYLCFAAGIVAIAGWLVNENYKLAAATVFFYLMGQKIVDLVKRMNRGSRIKQE